MTVLANISDWTISSPWYGCLFSRRIFYYLNNWLLIDNTYSLLCVFVCIPVWECVLVPMHVCAHECRHVYTQECGVFVYEHVCVFLCIERPEINITLLSLLLSTLVFVT